MKARTIVGEEEFHAEIFDTPTIRIELS